MRQYIQNQEQHQKYREQNELNADQRPLLGAFLIPPALPVVADSMGVHLKEKYRDQVFQVRAQASADPSIINQIMKCRNHVSTGFNMQDSPFANILVWVGRGAPDVPWIRLAEGYLYLGPRENFNSNTPIKGYITKRMFHKYKEYYKVCFGNGRNFNNAKEVDECLQQSRWPKPR